MNNNILKIAFLFLVGTFSSCDKNQNNCEAELKPDCVYTLEYNPVCGCNSVTYSNVGEAECNNITESTPGACSIIGEYNFLGFTSDGAKVGFDKQCYEGNTMTLILKEDADNDLLFPFEGTGQPNLFTGRYIVGGRNFTITGITEALGSQIEQKFTNVLPLVFSTKLSGDYLVMDLLDDLGGQLIFKKI